MPDVRQPPQDCVRLNLRKELGRWDNIECNNQLIGGAICQVVARRTFYVSHAVIRPSEICATFLTVVSIFSCLGVCAHAARVSEATWRVDDAATRRMFKVQLLLPEADQVQRVLPQANDATQVSA